MMNGWVMFTVARVQARVCQLVMHTGPPEGQGQLTRRVSLCCM
jgi:hypothetical protein